MRERRMSHTRDRSCTTSVSIANVTTFDTPLFEIKDVRYAAMSVEWDCKKRNIKNHKVIVCWWNETTNPCWFDTKSVLNKRQDGLNRWKTKGIPRKRSSWFWHLEAWWMSQKEMVLLFKQKKRSRTMQWRMRRKDKLNFWKNLKHKTSKLIKRGCIPW